MPLWVRARFGEAALANMRLGAESGSEPKVTAFVVVRQLAYSVISASVVFWQFRRYAHQTYQHVVDLC